MARGVLKDKQSPWEVMLREFAAMENAIRGMRCLNTCVTTFHHALSL